ncbi:MAG: polysaccharide deacetylase family protein [Anaerolineales bacterium]|jgi:hypothetical protein|nr:polysaccharide deacetylase family protein [Anaerolineales bacterium]
MRHNPLLSRLGFAPDDRVAIIHVDDVGMCQASIAAFAELWQFGLVTCGAVMMPCPWSLEAARFAREHPGADLGIHLTLTSEWDTYRWGPVSTRSLETGLVDSQRCFHRRSQYVQAQADPEAVQIELAAQVDLALANGIQPTHADTHMGTVAHPKFFQAYLQTAIQNGLPPMIPRLDEAGWRKMGLGLDDNAIAQVQWLFNSLEEMGVPLLDHIQGMPLDSDPALRYEHAKAAFDSLPPGITHFIIHAAQDSPELRAITPDWACRAADHQTFLREDLRAYLRQQGIHTIGYRALQALMPKTELSFPG